MSIKTQKIKIWKSEKFRLHSSLLSTLSFAYICYISLIIFSSFLFFCPFYKYHLQIYNLSLHNIHMETIWFLICTIWYVNSLTWISGIGTQPTLIFFTVIWKKKV
jgi:hypothetical protein